MPKSHDNSKHYLCEHRSGASGEIGAGYGMDAKWLKQQFDDHPERTQAALAALLNVHPTVVSKMVKGKRTIKATEADRIREFFGAPQPEMPARTNGRSDMRSGAAVSAGPNFSAPLPSQMKKDVPVYGTVSGGTGAFQVGGEAIDWARRPPRLEGRKDVFALFVEETSMVPVYRPGALIFVERARPPGVGDDVVIEVIEHEGDEPKAIIKRLVALTATLVKLEQFNPAKVLELPRKQVLRIYRVMTMMDLLGV